jgi:hypothetical protein
MVSKCANPECATPFRYFHEGKLFGLETRIGPERRRAMGAESDAKKSMRRLEFYWLCDRCAGKMTLIAEKGVGVSVRPYLSASASAA